MKGFFTHPYRVLATPQGIENKHKNAKICQHYLGQGRSTRCIGDDQPTFKKESLFHGAL